MRARRPTSAMPKPFLCCERAFCCSVVVMWCHEVACGVRWSNVLGCEVTWGELLLLVATWHVMSCHLMRWSCHLMRCDCLCCVMSRDAMRCHVMCAHVKSCHLLCPAMGWNVMSYEVKPPLFSKQLLCTTKYYSSSTPTLLCTSKYYSRTTPTLLCTSKYYSSTALCCRELLQYYSSTTLYYKVLLQYYKVLLFCSTKYDSNTTLYYKVRLQYYSVLQSTTPSFPASLPLPSPACTSQNTNRSDMAEGPQVQSSDSTSLFCKKLTPTHLPLQASSGSSWQSCTWEPVAPRSPPKLYLGSEDNLQRNQATLFWLWDPLQLGSIFAESPMFFRNVPWMIFFLSKWCLCF